jgi:hypothetical protein
MLFMSNNSRIESNELLNQNRHTFQTQQQQQQQRQQSDQKNHHGKSIRQGPTN